MAIRTSFAERFQVTHPLVLAPMAGISGGALAAAVSNAGGLGLVGGGYGDRGWLERELRTVAGSTSKPWGAGPGTPISAWSGQEKGSTSSLPSKDLLRRASRLVP